MRLSAQEEYGLRLLLQIARAPEGFLTIGDVAKREALTSAYAAKILRALRVAGLVRSTRGKKGGYELTLRPEEIRVGPTLEALGGRLYSEGFCQKFSGGRHDCVHDAGCLLRPLWKTLDDAVRAAVGDMRLIDLIGDRPAPGAKQLKVTA